MISFVLIMDTKTKAVLSFFFGPIGLFFVGLRKSSLDLAAFIAELCSIKYDSGC